MLPMRRWDLKIALDPERDLPLFLQLASAVAEGIRCGRLAPGDPLPGTRLLAEQLGVNRNTVIASYDELAAEGLVRTRRGGGTFVAELTGAVPTQAEQLTQHIPTYALGPMIELPRRNLPPTGVIAMR